MAMIVGAALMTSGFMVQWRPQAGVDARRSASAVTMFGEFMKKRPGDENSFVQTEMRAAAMKLHTKQQAPKEGQAEAKKVEQTPVQTWQPGRADYLQFLVDSREVYSTFEELVSSTPELQSLGNSGLERASALERDIAWFASEGLEAPECKEQGSSYATFVREMVSKGELEAFVCHFYNFYFAHTAGGRMIGKRMGAMLLDGKTLDFYAWEKDGESVDPSEELLPALRGKIDAMADGWTREQKDKCLAETQLSFKMGGALLQHISAPPAAAQPA